MDSVQDFSALDTFEEQHGAVPEVIRQQIDTETHVVVLLVSSRLGGGYCHGLMPDMGHVFHGTLAC
jgi:hypothetical protein